jgi:hypothetical protein
MTREEERPMTTLRPWLLIGLIAVTTAACATAPAGPAVDVTGRWAGTWAFTNPSLGGGTINAVLKQTGPDFNGDMTVTGAAVNRTGFVQGVVAGNEARIIAPPGLTGAMTVSGDEMRGLIHGVSDASVTLRRQR